MRGAKLIFNNIDFKDWNCTIEVSKPESLSWDTIYFERADVQPYFNKRKRRLKEVPVTCTMITDTKNQRENEKRADQFIGALFSLDSPWLQINDLYCRAILSEVERKFFSNAITFDMTFINLDGLWYGAEKSASIGSVEVGGVFSTDFYTIKVTASANNSKILLGDKFIGMNTTLLSVPIKIDGQKKTATQNGDHVELDLDSNFFELKVGINALGASGCIGSMTYREVVAL